jgi:hypothetical protein
MPIPETVVLFRSPVNKTFTRWLPVLHRSCTGECHNEAMTSTSTKGTVMTTEAIHPTHHFSPRTVLVALAGTALAVGAGFGAAAVTLDDGPEVTPTPAVITQYQPQLGSDLSNGTDRQDRELMHRR